MVPQEDLCRHMATQLAQLADVALELHQFAIICKEGLRL